MPRPKEHKPATILSAASAVFLREGVHVSTASVAKAAEVSNGTLFNYFPTKQALIDALYVSIKVAMAEALGTLDPEAPLQHRMKQAWDRWLTWAQEHRDDHTVMNLLHQSGLASEEAQEAATSAFQRVVDLLIEAQESGLFVDLPTEHLGAVMQQQLDQAIVSELDESQADVAFSVLWNGITRR